MGGFGSGRQDQIRKTGSIEEATCIDIRAITKAVADKHNHWLPLDTPESFNLYARIHEDILQVSQLKPSETHLYAELKLDRQPRHFGGHQHYLICPHCDRKACVLYLRIPKEIGCRSCLNLAYESQYYRHPAPLLLRANKKRESIGGKPGIINPIPEKPKGMHWRTYLHLVSEIRYLETEHVRQSYEMMGMVAFNGSSG